MPAAELCNWQYSRRSYCVIMHDSDNLEPTHAYFSPGTTDTKNPTSSLGDIPIKPFTGQQQMFLEDDDNVQTMAQKVSMLTLYRPEYLYFWIDNGDGTGVNMQFDLIYNVDANTSRRFNYSVIPSREFNEKIASAAEWHDGQRVVTQNFGHSFISSFNGSEFIHCMPLNRFVAYLGAKEASAIAFNVKTYFPEVRLGAPIIANLIEGASDALVKWNANDVNYQKQTSILLARNNSVRAIQSSFLDDKLASAEDMTFHKCNILEAVVHMNYSEHNENFVDLEKVFHMFPVSSEVPFSRLKTEKDTNYMIYKGATDEKSPDFINKRVLQDWIDPKLNRLLDVTDVHAVSALTYSRNVGRGLSFKILNYVTSSGEGRYMTLNIYKDGKIELKCFWDEQFGEDMNPGGNKTLLKEAVAKVRKFIKALNLLNYAVPGSKRQKITLPDSDPFGEGSTRIAFFNTISVFDFGGPLDYAEFTKYLEQYRAYIHLVTRLLSNNEIDTRSIELRYKRLHNYVHMKNIQRFIKNYKAEHPEMDAETRADLRTNVSVTFSLTREDAEIVIADYEATFESKKKRARKTVSRDDVSRILERDISTQSGIDIKIIKRNPKDMLDNTYKCLILGISPDLLGPIYHFLRHVVFYFKHHDKLAAMTPPKDEPNFLARLKATKDQTEDDTIKQGASEVISEVKTAISRKPTIAPTALGTLTAQEEEFEFDIEDDEEIVEEDDGAPAVEPVSERAVERAVEPAAATAKPSKAATAAVTTMVSSFLDLLQTRVKEAYGDNVPIAGEPTPYSTKCQKSEGRQPLVIPVDLANALKQHVNDKIQQLEQEAPTDDILNQLYEYRIHKNTLDRGMTYKPQTATTPYFYFCPLSWNMAVNTPDAVDMAFPVFDTNPQTKDASKNKYLYMSPKRKFKAEFKGSYNKWTELASADPKMRPEIIRGEPPHASYVRFIQTTADYSACRACCFVNKKDTPETAKCMGESKLPASSSSSAMASSSYIKAEGKFVEANRFAFIPAKLNRIFNNTDNGLKLVSGNNTTISTGFDYYLRKGVKDGKFLNAINELVPKIKDMVAYLSEILTDDIELFKSLKKGAINQLFAPEQLSSDTENDAKISLSNFIAYLETGSSEINEDFLWDLLSRPDVILPTPKELSLSGGVNIIICDVQLAGKRSTDVDSGIIKCPVGFEVDELFAVDRPSIILYRYKDNYEIICRVQQEDNRNIISNALFEAGHPLITDIINHISTKCHAFPNLKAEQELRRHMDSIQRDGIVNRSLLSHAELLDLHEALKMLKETNIDIYLAGASAPAPVQIVDSHNKVTHIKLSENVWLPIKPSGIYGTLPVMRANETGLPDLVTMVRVCEQLNTFENFNGYRPYAFMVDPGEDLDDPEDDIIIGLMLANGLICYTNNIPTKVFKQGGAGPTVISIEHPDKSLELDSHKFNMLQLLFTDTELWYKDYKSADEALVQLDRKMVDMRRVYSVRSSFEHESYQRLRYELSRLIADVYPAIGDRLRDIISQIPMGSLGSVGERVRTDVKNILKTLLKDYVTERSGPVIVNAVGPVNKGTEDLTEKEISGNLFNYNTPNIRYECFNRELDPYREPNDIHCAAGKLFISPVNLVTGKENNFDNYIARITEEILRIPIKRQEVLSGQMNNFISGLTGSPSNAYLLGSENMVDDFKRMYTSTVNYREKMRSHYDVINPQNYTEFDYNEDKKGQMNVEQRCTGRFVNLPSYWISKIRNMHWKVYDIRGSANCIYTELDSIIADATGLTVNTRNKIASTIGGGDFEGYGDRAGWELALDYYSHLWRADYNQIKTKEDLIESIRSSPRHHLSTLDLSLISRAYKIKFIVIAKPNRINRSGVVCLNTTQTQGDNIIVLYLQGLSDFSIVKNTSTSPEKSVFKLSELPEFLQKEWVGSCIRDNLPVSDPSNQLYRMAPTPAKGVSGRTVFLDPTGNIVANPNVKQVKIAVKPKTAAPVEPEVAPVAPVAPVSPVAPVASAAPVAPPEPEGAPAAPSRIPAKITIKLKAKANTK